MKANAFNSSGMIIRRWSTTAIASISPARMAPPAPIHPGAAATLAETAPAPMAPMKTAWTAPDRAKRWLRLLGGSAVTAQVGRGR